MKKNISRKSEFKEDLNEILIKNGRMIVIFTCLLIIVSGITIINNPSRWWVAILGVISWFVIFFMIFNARVIIKSTISILFTLIGSAWAFKAGSLANPYGIGGSIWMITIILSYLTCLTLSYWIASNRGRWSVLTISTTVSFFITYIFAISTLNVTISAISGGIINIIIFLFLYKFNLNYQRNKKKLPEVYFTESTMNKIIKDAENNGWGAVKLKKKPAILLWNSQHAYVITTIKMRQNFGNSGIKTQVLSYDGVPINLWLMKLCYKYIPSWGTRNADILLVLLDDHNKNGQQARTIGVRVPDSNKVIPVGVLPAEKYLQQNNSKKSIELFNKLESEFTPYVRELGYKQSNALDKKLPDDFGQDKE